MRGVRSAIACSGEDSGAEVCLWCPSVGKWSYVRGLKMHPFIFVPLFLFSGGGVVVGNCDFNENPAVPLDLDFDLGFVNNKSRL